MAIDKYMSPELAKLQLDLVEWMKRHPVKQRNPYQGHTWRRGHTIEGNKKRYSRKRKHKQELT